MSDAGLFVAGALGAATLTALWVWRWRARVAAHFESSDAARRPRGADGVVVGAATFQLEGRNGAAVLLLHGFNDTPQSMAYLGARLHEAGYTVHALRLPGHGCSLPEMARAARAEAWRESVREALAALRAAHDRVYLCGQSMGGALALLEAAHEANEENVRALVLLAPFIGVPPKLDRQFRLARLSPAPYHKSLGGERSLHDDDARRAALGPGIVTASALLALRQVALDAEAALPLLRVPTLYMQSTLDNRVGEADARRHFSRIGANDKEQLWLSGSGHIISADFEKSLVADRVIAWFGGHR